MSESPFVGFKFHPVIQLPENYEVYDFTCSYDPSRKLSSPYGIGRYNEKRPGMYTAELFKQEPGNLRDIHIGIDISAPVGTPVHAFYDGTIFLTGINSATGDYGGTMITEHLLGEKKIWALHGHLSHSSVEKVKPGQKIRVGEVIAWVGDRHENGGWNPHVHFQLSVSRPERCDMPGTVSQRDREKALRDFPDPRWVLGPLY